MANQLDLEEQEQLDQIKHFWQQYGNLISWLLIAVLGAFASWNFYNYWQRQQATQAAAMYDEVERVAHSGDLPKLDRAWTDMKDKFSSTTYAQQAGLLAAKVYFSAGKTDQTEAALAWVAEQASDEGYRAIAKLRLSGVLLEAKSYDQALKQLSGNFPTEFKPLVTDRMADIYLQQGNTAQAIQHYNQSYKGLDERVEYRSLVEVKLNALGVNPRESQAKEGAK